MMGFAKVQPPHAYPCPNCKAAIIMPNYYGTFVDTCESCNRDYAVMIAGHSRVHVSPVKWRSVPVTRESVGEG